jgi:hypothetical protein
MFHSSLAISDVSTRARNGGKPDDFSNGTYTRCRTRARSAADHRTDHQPAAGRNPVHGVCETGRDRDVGR